MWVDASNSPTSEVAQSTIQLGGLNKGAAVLIVEKARVYVSADLVRGTVKAPINPLNI